MRLAIAKYIKSKTMEDYDEAIIRCFEENIFPYLRRFDSQEFRLGKLYKENCDNVLRRHLQTLKDIYRKASCVDALPGEDTVMSMQEFVDLVVVTGCVEDSFGARDIGTLYNLSIMTQVDEIHSDRHL